MTGWNLPPGVNVHDIPGNRPEDEDEGAFWAAFYERVTEEYAQAEGILQAAYDLDFTSLVTRLIEIARDMGYKRGYDDGVNDLGRAEDWQERQQ